MQFCHRAFKYPLKSRYFFVPVVLEKYPTLSVVKCRKYLYILSLHFCSWLISYLSLCSCWPFTNMTFIFQANKAKLLYSPLGREIIHSKTDPNNDPLHPFYSGLTFPQPSWPKLCILFLIRLLKSEYLHGNESSCMFWIAFVVFF